MPLRPLVSLCLGLGIWLAPMPAATQDAPFRSITVQGEGRVDAQPDIARITIGVEAQARTARDALRNNSDLVANIFATLADEGVAEEDIQTSQLSLSPVWDHSQARQQPQVIGYQARNMATIRVRDLDQLGSTLDAVSTAGANRIHSIQFGLTDPSQAMEEARRRAIRDARARAELMVGEAGTTQGRVMTITESLRGGGPAPMAMARAESADMGVPVAGGEVTTQVIVTVVYELAD